MEDNKKLKFCLVGAGSIGRRHLRLLNERTDVEVSVAEPSDKLWSGVAETFKNNKRYASLDEALNAEKFDAVLIATPHSTHAALAIQALDAGLHVFCEKPMSESLKECVDILNAVKKSGKVFSAGFMYRFDPFVLKVKELIDQGRIGNIVHFHSRISTYNTLLCSVTRHQANTPYSLISDNIHDSDLLHFLTGKIPDYAFSTGVKAGDMELSSPPNVMDTVYRYASGDMVASAHFDYVGHPQTHGLHITGDRGYILGDFMAPSIELGNIDGTVERITLTREFDDVYRAEWARFIAAVKGEAKPENTAESASASTLLTQAQRESAETGKEIDVRALAKRYGLEI